MKNKGGRGKTNDFSTVVMRIPAPLKGRIEEIVSEFYETQKPVTSIENEIDNTKPITDFEINNTKPVTGIESCAPDSIPKEKPKSRVSNLRLAQNIKKILRREKIRTVEQLENLLLSGELRKVSGIGDVAVDRITNALKLKQAKSTV